MRPSLHRERATVAAFLLAAVPALGCASKQQVRAKNEAHDEAALSFYRQLFQPGMSRNEVEVQLREKGRHFSRSETLPPRVSWSANPPDDRSGAGSFSDMIRIRNEHVSWLCSDMVVFVAIRFAAADGSRPRAAQGTDKLTEVSLYNLAADCP